MTDQQLEELEELYRSTVPGPWDGVISANSVRYLGPPTKRLEHGETLATCSTTAMSLLIAEMHSALPEMIAEIRRSRGLPR